MLSSVLKYVEDRKDIKKAREFVVAVTSTCSSDGRSLDPFYIDWSPNDTYCLFLLENALNASTGIKEYSVYGENGVRLTEFDRARYCKRW